MIELLPAISLVNALKVVVEVTVIGVVHGVFGEQPAPLQQKMPATPLPPGLSVPGVTINELLFLVMVGADGGIVSILTL